MTSQPLGTNVISIASWLSCVYTKERGCMPFVGEVLDLKKEPLNFAMLSRLSRIETL